MAANIPPPGALYANPPIPAEFGIDPAVVAAATTATALSTCCPQSHKDYLCWNLLYRLLCLLPLAHIIHIAFDTSFSHIILQS